MLRFSSLPPAPCGRCYASVAVSTTRHRGFHAETLWLLAPVTGAVHAMRLSGCGAVASTPPRGDRATVALRARRDLLLSGLVPGAHGSARRARANSGDAPGGRRRTDESERASLARVFRVRRAGRFRGTDGLNDQASGLASSSVEQACLALFASDSWTPDSLSCTRHSRQGACRLCFCARSAGPRRLRAVAAAVVADP